LELKQLVPVHAHAPRRVDLGYRAVTELEDGVRGVIGGGVVAPPVLIPALGDMRGRLGRDPGHRADQFLQHIRPVREHLQDNPADGFSTYTSTPAETAFSTASYRALVTCASK